MAFFQTRKELYKYMGIRCYCLALKNVMAWGTKENLDLFVVNRAERI